MKIAFIQPFSLADSNGGARILRGLARGAPVPVVSVNTGLKPPSRGTFPNEVFLPFRPHFGRVERTRLAWLPTVWDQFWVNRWKPKFRRYLTEQGVTHLHVVPHTGLDSAGAADCARELSLPLWVSIHDHPRYAFRGGCGFKSKWAAVGRVWLEAERRFVISEPMGQSMNLSFGERSFEVITDGVEAQPLAPKRREPGLLRLYFMGLFHQGYTANLVCLVEALRTLAQQNSGLRIVMTLRCGSVPDIPLPVGVEMEVLPFASEDQVRRDIETADLLYLPLPFGEAYHDFVDYSLSTKMVTYLGSGRPILYHGPESAAAGVLLNEHQAAFIVGSMDSSRMTSVIQQATPDRVSELVKQALQLTESRFRMGEIQARFWSAIFRK